MNLICNQTIKENEEKIAELENITPSEEELEAEYAKLAESYGVEADKVKSVIPAEEISKDLAVGKAIDLVKENAVITEVEEKTEEEAEKKLAEEETLIILEME